MSELNNITLIILAGGKSTRMGTDKALLKIQEKNLIEIVYDNLKELASEIIISTNNPDVTIPGTKTVADIYKNIGPAGGIYSALSVSNSQKNIIISVDTPFVTKTVFEYLLNPENSKANVCIVSENNSLHPLIGIYSKQFTEILQKEIQKGNYKIRDIIKKTSYEIIDVYEKEFYDKHLFQNINTKEDYLSALKNLQ